MIGWVHVSDTQLLGPLVKGWIEAAFLGKQTLIFCKFHFKGETLIFVSFISKEIST